MEEGEEQSKSNVPSENPILTSLPSNIEDEHQDVDIVNDEDGQLEIAMSVNERLKKVGLIAKQGIDKLGYISRSLLHIEDICLIEFLFFPISTF